jgi:formate/nitrite transporter FocA (FNT family)
VAARIVSIAEAKTIGNAVLGSAGMVSVFVRGILCNWLVCLGVVMGMTSTSTAGKIAAIWLPIFLFFALGFEHAVVNVFLIPTGMLLGAKVSVYDWWVWNQIPVTLGNLVGGFVFTGLALRNLQAGRSPGPGRVDCGAGGRVTAGNTDIAVLPTS